MSDKMKEAMQELNMDDLDEVNGGVGIVDAAAALLGIRKKKTVPDSVVTSSECCAPAGGLQGTMPDNTGLSKTVKAICPNCGKETDFTVFTGGRAVCSCGYVRTDM